MARDALLFASSTLNALILQCTRTFQREVLQFATSTFQRVEIPNMCNRRVDFDAPPPLMQLTNQRTGFLLCKGHGFTSSRGHVKNLPCGYCHCHFLHNFVMANNELSTTVFDLSLTITKKHLGVQTKQQTRLFPEIVLP